MKRITGLLCAMIFCASLIVSLPIHSVSAAEYEESIRIVADQALLNQDEDADSNAQQDTQDKQDEGSTPGYLACFPDGEEEGF